MVRSRPALKLMKTAAISVLLLVCPVFGSATALEGAWLSCPAKAPWTLLSVERDGERYRWTAEWGAPYAASGLSQLRNGELVLRGCSSYRGKVDAGCDEKSPPVFGRLRKQDFERIQTSFTTTDIRLGRWVRVAKGASWQELVHKCEQAAEMFAAKQKKVEK